MRIFRCLCICLVCILCFSVGAKASSFDSEKQKLTNKVGELADLENEIATNLTGLNKSLHEKSIQLSMLEEEIEEQEQEIQNKEQRIDSLGSTVDMQRTCMFARIRYNYENSRGQSDLFSFFTAGGDIAKLLQTKEYSKAVQAYDKRLIDAYEEAITNLYIERAELGQMKKDFVLKQTALNKEKEQLLGDIAANEERLKNTQEERIAKQEELHDLMEKMKIVERMAGYADGSMTMEEINAIHAAGTGTRTPVTAASGEEELLAAIIFCEAGGEPFEGQMAVASVVINRVNSPRFPNTITDVIYSPRQFTPAGSGRLAVVLANGLTTDSCRLAARQALSGNITGSWLFFRVNDGSRQGQVIGRQVFY